MQTVNIAVLTVSDSRTLQNDKSGDYLQSAIEQDHHKLVDREITKDDIYDIRAVVSRWISDKDIDVIITTGGTGVTGRDGTPEAIQPLLDKELVGFGEMFRHISFEEIHTSSLQSRCLAGVANGTYIFVLPGSSGACRTGWEKIIRHQLNVETRPCNLVQLIPRLKEHR